MFTNLKAILVAFNFGNSTVNLNSRGRLDVLIAVMMWETR